MTLGQVAARLEEDRALFVASIAAAGEASLAGDLGECAMQLDRALEAAARMRKVIAALGATQEDLRTIDEQVGEARAHRRMIDTMVAATRSGACGEA